MGDFDGPSGMGPAPPRVTLLPTPRAPSQEQYRSIPDRGHARGSFRRRSAEGRLSAVPYQPQQLLPQGDRFLQRLQLTLCALCTAFLATVPRSEDVPLQEPSSTAHLPGRNAGPTEE